MKSYLFELLKRIEEVARQLASTITNAGKKPLRDVTLLQVELEQITNALDAFKAEVAALVGGREV